MASHISYIDLHCDTLMMFAGDGGNLYENEMSVDIARLQKGNCLAQFFAIWMPDGDGRRELEKKGVCKSLSGELSDTGTMRPLGACRPF